MRGFYTKNNNEFKYVVQIIKNIDGEGCIVPLTFECKKEAMEFIDESLTKVLSVSTVPKKY